MKIFKLVALFVLVSAISFASPISVLVQPGGSGTTYDSTTPIEVQKISVGTTTVGAAGELIASGAGQFDSLSVGTTTRGITGEVVSPLFEFKSTRFKFGAANTFTSGQYSALFGTSNTSHNNNCFVAGNNNAAAGHNNYIFGAYSSAGSTQNFVVGDHSTTGANYCSSIGFYNDVSGSYSGTSSGYDCDVTAAQYSSISGGYGNITEGTGTAILSGLQNSASAPWSVIAGGYNNKINDVLSSGSVILGGRNNTYAGYSYYSVLAGDGNSSVNSPWSAIFGKLNSASRGSNLTFGESNNNGGGYTLLGGYNNVINTDCGPGILVGQSSRVDVGYFYDLSGLSAYGTRTCQRTLGGGQFSTTRGSAQMTDLIAMKETTDATPTRLTVTGVADSAAYRWTIASGVTNVGTIDIVGASNDANRSSYGVSLRFKAKRINDDVIIATGSTEIFADTGLGGCSVTLKDDDTNGAYYVEVVGSSTATMRWVASVRMVETRMP